MRLLVFILSFYLVFGQIYQAHALLPAAVATARGVGVLVKAGTVVRGSQALAGSAYKWCKANPLACAIVLGKTAEKVSEMFDDDEYGVPTEQCGGRWMYGSLQGGIHTSSGSHLAHARKVFYDYAVQKSRNNAPEKPVKNPNFRPDGGTYMRDDDDKVYQNIIYDVYDFWGRDSSEIVQIYRYCDKTQDKPSDDDLKREREEEQKKREKELWDKLKDKLSDDDITNIVNNYGDDIDIDKYCASGATCYFIDTDFEKEINNNDYDIDKIDDKNCKTRNGKIYSCPNAKKKKDRDDDDGQTNNDDGKKDDGQTNNDDKKDDNNGLGSSLALPTFCIWAKPICDFILSEPKMKPEQVPENDITLKTPEEFDRNHVNIGGSCPADVVANFNTGFAQNQIRFEMQPICNYVSNYFRPVVIFIAYIWAVIYIGSAFKVQ